jgi:hypothetical protein
MIVVVTESPRIEVFKKLSSMKVPSFMRKSKREFYTSWPGARMYYLLAKGMSLGYRKLVKAREKAVRTSKREIKKIGSLRTFSLASFRRLA